MNARTWTTAALGLSALLLTSVTVSAAGKDTPVSWKKTVIEGKFRSEGVAIADVNKDGKLDVLIGDSWYEAPSWTKRDIRKPGDFGDGLHSYSACMACWADDINGDGWVDQLVVGFPGAPAYWYENPKGKEGHWPQHEIWHSACNETPLYTDLFGDGRRVLVMGWQPKGKDNEGQMAWFVPGSDPTQPWEMHPISEPSSPGKPTPGTFRFSHGLGVGDLNRDGRNDVICTDGWWEQPESGRKSGTSWAFHPAQLQGAVADMITYDVNGDGKADVIDSSAHQYGIWWYEQGALKDGSPTFMKHDLFPDLVSETHALIAADINGDGLKDLVTGKRFWSHGRSEAGSDKPARLYWFEASRDAGGKTTFTPREIDDQSGIGTQFVVADFNGDGLLDIITANKKGVFLLEQNRAAQ
ncbi:MAG: VCBS repeat-containing protein [Isosphaeraceae bacterium]|nr:VCBS repeat-containing protein [Isosphaeraceae bacterium]